MTTRKDYPAIAEVLDEIDGWDQDPYATVKRVAKHVEYPAAIIPSIPIDSALYKLNEWIEDNYSGKN
jgi:hypothetical protein